MQLLHLLTCIEAFACLKHQITIHSDALCCKMCYVPFFCCVHLCTSLQYFSVRVKFNHIEQLIMHKIDIAAAVTTLNCRRLSM